ncbi:DUF1194 domain-containing protein [Tateyamaria sp. SN3-11]|uniref:DUF1194 domain-containing protein n=1 Tax=Tateyamaria sp. SN3-11 TaxID=3092147 RepID=UPI0039EA8B5A
MKRDLKFGFRVQNLRPLALGWVIALALLPFGWMNTVLAKQPVAVDLQLVLAVDVSGSVDAHDFALQMDGIASALRNPSVIDAIKSGPHRRIAVSLVLWSDPERPKVATAWYVLDDEASADLFAREVESQPQSGAGGTGIGRALLFSINQFDDNGMTSGRKVIDLSGDGRENLFGERSVRPQAARLLASERGITINGLAILTDEPMLDLYYKHDVIIGADAFVMSVENLPDFAEAMRRKLVREISHFAQKNRLEGQVVGVLD